jgi:2-iminobutanoate/2-iminopropanoate deaminase
MINRHLPTPIMHRAVQAGSLLFFGGIVAHDTSADMRAQTQQILARLGEYLAAAGSDKTRVVSATVFVTDLSLKSELNKAWLEWFDASHLPARATLEVSDLGGYLVEVSAVAAAAT